MLPLPKRPVYGEAIERRPGVETRCCHKVQNIRITLLLRQLVTQTLISPACLVAMRGVHHLYVSEMTQGCGLVDWMTNMQIAHATSPSPEGPFVKCDIAVLPLSTNPEAVVDNTGEWWLPHL